MPFPGVVFGCREGDRQDVTSPLVSTDPAGGLFVFIASSTAFAISLRLQRIGRKHLIHQVINLARQVVNPFCCGCSLSTP